MFSGAHVGVLNCAIDSITITSLVGWVGQALSPFYADLCPLGLGFPEFLYFWVKYKCSVTMMISYFDNDLKCSRLVSLQRETEN